MAAIPLLVTLLVSLGNSPHVPLREYRLDAFLMPVSLIAMPMEVFAGLPDYRLIDIPRAIMRLALAYLVYAVLGAIWRTLKRLAGRRVQVGTGSILDSFGTVLALWGMAWRTGVLAFIPKEKVARPWDATTSVGVVSGAICAIAEIRNIKRTVMPSDDRARSGFVSRVVQVLLAIHRILLAVRVISGALAPSAPVPIPATSAREL
ncbi:hypothetical protein IAU60_003711 [Kwoniella sp. DSM 27419]